MATVRMRELYYFDHGQDFGLSGFAGTLCSRATLRTDVPVVLALAGAQADDEDDQLGRDVRLLLESPLPDEVLHAVWLAAVRRCFDPAEEGTDIRCWLRRVAEVCPPCTRERERAEPEFLDRVRPTVTEEDVRLLLDSALSDEAVTALWRTASRRLYVDASFDADEGFDADVRAWLERVARACRERLGEVDPGCVPYLSPARTDLAGAVLREVREVREAERAEAAEVRDVARVLEDVAATVDPDLGFRLLLQVLLTPDARRPARPLPGPRRTARIQRRPSGRPTAPPDGLTCPPAGRRSRPLSTSTHVCPEAG
ncbi:hypothetical protein [Streptomyces sp. NBC_01767]|uniref:hypothetical protein n=1 Tax=Streptomyces sp. NBC_01767 TaxID=2975937 RepID=UPI002250B74A|nr:hypothetical protein [Streptomyces sp. NBC_01767]MCX4393020.1 hypothetical protein [Streptomyces sp. NBC_01767]